MDERVPITRKDRAHEAIDKTMKLANSNSLRVALLWLGPWEAEWAKQPMQIHSDTIIFRQVQLESGFG